MKTRAGIERFEEQTAKRVVTTGCGQGSVFGGLMDEVDSACACPTRAAARIRQATLYAHARRDPPAGEHLQVGRLGARLRAVPRRRDADSSSRTSAATTRSTPSPAGCGCTTCGGGDKIFYTTGRLTSEMVIKSAQMGVPIVVSRSGITQMGHELASGSA